MGDVSIAGSDTWKLAAPHDAHAQGFIVSAFAHLPKGEALLLRLPQRAGGAWLKALSDVDVQITNAGGLKPPPSVALAFTSTGLKAMGLDDVTLATFSTPFVEGMRQKDRQRRLGDTDDNGTVIPGGPIWSGNAPDPYAISRWAVAKPTKMTVHAALLLYERDQDSLDRLTNRVEEALKACKVKIVRRIALWREAEGPAREHFGFVDGISQPVPYGPTIVPNRVHQWHAAPAGDFLIGHADANGEPSPGPIVSDNKPGADHLEPGTAPYGYRDLGLDGSYVVIRELKQEVGAFRASMDRAARALGRDADWLAARVIGRTLDGDPLCPDGDPLCPDGVIPPTNGQPANDFGFARPTPQTSGCPIGAHIRRANPRDGLAPRPDDEETFLRAANNHRILRRGRKFGPPYDEAPGAERGLLFIAINTDIARQFEFIQQTWMLNPRFASLFDETDPLMGPKGPFTVPDQPVRARVNVKTFVQLVGGDYFFLPSLPAVKFLEQLP